MSPLRLNKNITSGVKLGTYQQKLSRPIGMAFSRDLSTSFDSFLYRRRIPADPAYPPTRYKYPTYQFHHRSNSRQHLAAKATSWWSYGPSPLQISTPISIDRDFRATDRILKAFRAFCHCCSRVWCTCIFV